MEGGYVSCRKPISGRCQPWCTRVSAKKCAPRPTYESFILQGGDEDSIEFHRQYLQAGKYKDYDEDPTNDAGEPTPVMKRTRNVKPDFEDPRGGAYKKYTTRRFARAPTPPPVQYAKYTGPRRNCAYNSPCLVAGTHDWQLRGPGNYICVHCDCYFDDR